MYLVVYLCPLHLSKREPERIPIEFYANLSSSQREQELAPFTKSEIHGTGCQDVMGPFPLSFLDKYKRT
jgi:hypothetical protein